MLVIAWSILTSTSTREVALETSMANSASRAVAVKVPSALMKLPREASIALISACRLAVSPPAARATNFTPSQNLYWPVVVLKIRRPVLAAVRVLAAVVSAAALKRSMYTWRISPDALSFRTILPLTLMFYSSEWLS
ncbi:hypothetical protein D3C75_433210 [compost metagenome]